MALFGPSIPAAILHTAEGPQLVHPAADRWWHNLQHLRLASQSSRLTCPDCGQRLVFVCEKVPTPYFRHYRDTDDCVDEQSTSSYERRVQWWLRSQLVFAFRSVLPEGTRIDADEYLANRRSSMNITLPRGGCFRLEVITEAQELSTFHQRQAGEMPLVPVFVGRRIPGAVAEAARVTPDGGTAAVSMTGLNADHDAAGRPLRVDMAHVAIERFYGLPLLVRAPQTLLFFSPGPKRDDPSHLLLLRGLMPNPAETSWHGRVIKALMTPGQVRFSLQHGFFTTADVAALKQMRDLFRRRRRQDASARKRAPGCTHPLEAAWQAKTALMEAAELQRQQVEAERRRQDEEARRAFAEHGARMADARRQAQAEEHRRREDEQARKEQAKRTLAHRLLSEGTTLLNGAPIPIPHPEVFATLPLKWQSLFLGFAFRAGVSFTRDQCIDWLRGSCPWVLTEPLLPRESWHSTLSITAFLNGAVERGLLARDGRLLYPTEEGGWLPPPAVPTGAICLLCGTYTWSCLDYDPATGYCRCEKHR